MTFLVEVVVVLVLVPYYLCCVVWCLVGIVLKSDRLGWEKSVITCNARVAEKAALLFLSLLLLQVLLFFFGTAFSFNSKSYKEKRKRVKYIYIFERIKVQY